MNLFYHNEYDNLTFEYFTNKGYTLFEIKHDSYDYIDKIENGDVLFIKLDDIDKIHTSHNITLFLFINHEYCNNSRREEILKLSPKNYTIYFLTTHLDNTTIDNDLSLSAKCLPFSMAFSNRESNNTIRSKKFNFFNRSINLRRLKAFELLKMNNIELNDCYYTFGNIIKRNTFKDVTNISEFFYYRSRPGGGRSNDDLVIDIDLLESHRDEFTLLEDRDLVEHGIIQNSSTAEMYDEINKQSEDSYITFTIESSSDSSQDLRITEKTVRSWLYKNIFVSLQCVGFNSALRRMGIETFEDVFGLQVGWDNNPSETYRITTFINALKRINEMPIDEVRSIYESESVQQRLEKNYKFIMDSFNPMNTILEIDKLIGYENNVYK